MRNIIKKYKDFQMADDAPKFICDLFILRARPTIFPDDARYGITVTKKTFKRAVDRNRAKRLLRVWIRANNTNMLPDADYRFIARTNILNAGLDQGVTAVARAIKNINKSLKRTPTGAIVPK